MASFPYTSNVGRFKDFILKLQGARVPAKVTRKVIEALGFKSKNDRPFIAVLKFLGFLDQNGVPTELWSGFRDRSKAGVVLATAMKNAYSELFDLYPDANRKDNEALRNFFSTHSDVGKGALNYMVQTFNALTDMADFDAQPDLSTPVTATKESNSEKPIHGGQQLNLTRLNNADRLTININIELSLPETSDQKTYDLFFQAMKKHLLSSPDDE
jgi:hypothetical protein